MKYFIFVVLFLLSNVALAEDQKQNSPISIKYSLSLSFDVSRQKIVAQLHNNSDKDLQIQNGLSTISLFYNRIKLFAFEDSENLSRIPLRFNIESDPSHILIKSNENYEGIINLLSSPKYYCQILDKNPIIIFWIYSYHNTEFYFFPKTGVFRLEKSDVKC